MVPLGLILLCLLVNPRPSVSSPSYQPKKEEEEISPNGLVAEITTCQGCRLSSYKAVQTFLLEGHAETYRGVSVLFVDARDPVMVIKEQVGGKARQSIPLKHYKTVAELHELMEKLGFQKRSRRELERYTSQRRSIQEKQDQENLERSLSEYHKLQQKKDDIAKKVLKLMEDNLKKERLREQEIKV
jgi:hypothetical protein